MTLPVSIVADVVSTFSLAAQQNAYPVLKSLRLEYTQASGDDEKNADVGPVSSNEALPTLRNVRLVLCGVSEWLEEQSWPVDELTPGQSLFLPRYELKLPVDLLFALTEAFCLDLKFELRDEDDTVLAQEQFSIDVLPANYWGGESRQPDLLAAFVKPNGVYVESLLKQATDVLEQAGHGRVIDGYQSNTRDKPYLMLAALWNVIFNQRLAYVSPPVGFAESGQRIRLASDISNSKITACLDTSLLFASCIEAMGLNAVVAVNQGHAFAGAWLIDERFPVLTNDDPMDIRKRVDNRDMVLFETTLATNDQPITFKQSCDHARRLIDEDNEDEFVYVIDIAQARARKIKPLSTVEQRSEESQAEEQQSLTLPELPPLPKVRADERIIVETPETRVESWTRKLLDLTKRNSLLNFRERAVSIKLYCPDIGLMEDLLASGESFAFLSAEESPVNDQGRDQENFRMQTGSDLHREYALEQLNKKILIANQSHRRLLSNAVALYRKAKNDLEEGGSNTLYLALGMLKWKENPDDDRSYRAPLILIPVQLSRKTASSPIMMQQLNDEEPIFNATLIEFLLAEHAINLSEFSDALPTDNSGVDVALVWQRVREAVRDHKGFEVVEELALASFSFAKFLMWSDLKERTDDLKKNPFVKHMVDHPREPYAQDSHFIERDAVDRDIDPAEVFTPLNCDSSQLVAVEASGRAQDFVLEGPPGTGKSETIANMIAHNIGKGRKVLFVAEKMAALHVVYRRMEKVGLGHLCLELHSNKANKRAVLEQLGHALDQRQGLTEAEWNEKIAELKRQKDELNNYVRALHHVGDAGFSVRDTISKLAGKQDLLTFELDWPLDLSSNPVRNSADLKNLSQVAGDLGTAFKDIAQVDAAAMAPVQATTWSHAWQSSFVQALEQLSEQLSGIDQIAKELLASFATPMESLDTQSFEALKQLLLLIELALASPIDYALAKGGKERLAALKVLLNKKQDYDELMQRIAHNINHERLSQTPVDAWLQRAEEAKSGGLKAWWQRWQLNAEAKKLGFFKFNDLALIEPIAQAHQLQQEITTLQEGLNNPELWQGWETRVEHLQERLNTGEQAHAALHQVLRLNDDPTSMAIELKRYLLDGREYLEASKIAQQAQQLADRVQALDEQLSRSQTLGFHLSSSMRFDAAIHSIGVITQDKTQLKNWCEWQTARHQAKQHHLGALVRAMDAGRLAAGDAEQQFEMAYCTWLTPLLIDDNPLLRGFKASSHELTIQRFRDLDQHIAQVTSQYINALMADRAPSAEQDSHRAAMGLISRELQKKSRNLPIRKLVGQLGDSLLNLCPCLMMSPLSVAQFLPPDFSGFDVVIFDEASQMTTWDSVGAIARGNNVVVVGDPKQMPPTNFFSGGGSEDDPDEEDLESILDQALAARLPLRRLMGHYRSRHETLIAFSNSKYYENSLVTYPSSDAKESAVVLHRVDGVYSKGKGRNNPIEAKAVVAEVVRRLTDPELAKLSIGVVSLNTDQQRLILDLLDDARRAHPEIEPYFHNEEGRDAVFVKNLEAVQGDERDVIMLSLAYGPTEPGGKTMSMNFGPLNKDGGERRLNVAITRATSEVLLFSSFDAGMVDLSRTSATAVEHLKHYLEFAERGPIALPEQSTAAYGVDQFDSEFERAVAVALREKGWRVQTQVGVSKFRVDLGVLHPDQPGIYLAGVECDGATYHGSPAARDRDRIRQAILENLGWRIIRLWSTDYFIDPERAVENIHQQLQACLEDDRQAAGTPAEPVSDTHVADEESDSHLMQEDVVSHELTPEASNGELDVPEEIANAEVASAEAGSSAEVEIATASNTTVLAAKPALKATVASTPLAAMNLESSSPSSTQPKVVEQAIEYIAEDYFEDTHRERLATLSRSILQGKSGITLHSLAAEVAQHHGIGRVTSKQINHLKSIVEPWAGMAEVQGQHMTLWHSPDDVVEEIQWRGLNAFGTPRHWKEIAYQEALGLARHALEQEPEDPLGFMFNELDIKRRHASTVSAFGAWLDVVRGNRE